MRAALLAACAIALPALAQNLPGLPPVALPALPAGAADAAGFVPPGWKLEDSASGDLNGDGVADLALLLRATDPANIVAHAGLGTPRLDSNPRILAIAFARPGGRAGYALAAQDGALIGRHTDPTLEDPVAAGDTLAVARGVLRVALLRESNAGSWWTERRSFAFRWQDGHFALIGFDAVAHQRNTDGLEEISANYGTGRATFTSSDGGTGKPVVRRFSLRGRPVQRLGGMGHWQDFDPGVPR